jgi:hypothetical protein
VTRALGEDAIRNAVFIAFVLYECQGAHDATFFFVGVAVGRAEHSLAGPFQSKAAACAWIETQTISRRWRAHRTRDDNKSPAQGAGLKGYRWGEDRYFPTRPSSRWLTNCTSVRLIDSRAPSFGALALGARSRTPSG